MAKVTRKFDEMLFSQLVSGCEAEIEATKDSFIGHVFDDEEFDTQQFLKSFGEATIEINKDFFNTTSATLTINNVEYTLKLSRA